MSNQLDFKCLVLLVLSLPCLVFGFGFSYTAPSSCDNITVFWSGGHGPFSLLITPSRDVPHNISIPDSAVDSSSGNGSFSFQLTLPPGKEFLLTMSDSTGFESGGTSDVLTVGSSVAGANCNTTPPTPDFTFQLNSALQQCRTFTFSGYEDAAQPVRILGLIPLGQFFELDPPPGPASFDWIANVPGGTSIAFIMTDTEGGQGGSSEMRTVGTSDDDSCINASSPRSTAQASSTQTGVATATETVEVQSGSNVGVIAGATVGGIALFAIAALASFLCFRRRKRGKQGNSATHIVPVAFVGPRSSRVSRMRHSFLTSNARMRRAPSSFDLLPAAALHRQSRRDSQLNQTLSGDEYLPNPYILPSEASAADGHSVHGSMNGYSRAPPPSTYHPGTSIQSHARSHSLSETYQPLSPISNFSNPYSQSHSHSRRPSDPFSNYSISGGPRSPGKASHAGTTRSVPRLVLHTDAEDAVGSDDGEEVVELPPRYTDRRDPNASTGQTKGVDPV